MSTNGDEHLVSAGILLPCARQFGWMSTRAHCDRPYGHTGPHTAEKLPLMAGARDAEDEARTVFVLTQLLGDGPEEAA